MPEKQDRAVVMKNYARRQNRRGLKQVKLWVPEDLVPWLHDLAADARTLNAVGRSALNELPDAILPLEPSGGVE